VSAAPRRAEPRRIARDAPPRWQRPGPRARRTGVHRAGGTRRTPRARARLAHAVRSSSIPFLSRPRGARPGSALARTSALARARRRRRAGPLSALLSPAAPL
jgi:hypothetical protein